MSLAESACYTLINVPDTEPYNEMQIKIDLGELTLPVKNLNLKFILQFFFSFR